MLNGIEQFQTIIKSTNCDYINEEEYSSYQHGGFMINIKSQGGKPIPRNEENKRRV
jgi:hypothetical protein